MNPPLTVLMAVYNGAPFLRTAIDSILGQSYRDFRFLIVDDASTDDTREIACSYDDRRIELLCLDRNVGQTAALNIGIRRASTPWIARMDADDYSAPSRLEEQMNALEAEASLSCVGTFCWTFSIDPKQVERMVAYAVCHQDIKRALLRGAPMAHPSIVVRRSALLDVGGYDERYRISADLEMYDRLLAKYRAANIPRPLLGLRRHENQISSSRTAAEEGIEIFLRRLAVNSYSPTEAALVRAGLAAMYFERGRHWLAERNYSALINDCRTALGVSPKTFLWQSIRLPMALLLRRRALATARRFFANRFMRFAS